MGSGHPGRCDDGLRRQGARRRDASEARPAVGGRGRALTEAGLDADAVLELDDLVSGKYLLRRNGVTGGVLLRRSHQSDDETVTESIVISQGSVRFMDAWQPGSTRAALASDDKEEVALR